jgi:hypothetical protein
MAPDFAQTLRASAWDTYVACLLGFSHHPGARRDGATPMTLEEIYATADAVLKERDLRFAGEV